MRQILTFRRAEPFVFGIFVSGDHVGENEFSNFLNGALVIVKDLAHSFNGQNEGFKRGLLQGIFSLTLKDGSEKLDEFFVESSEHLGFSIEDISNSSNGINTLKYIR